MANVPHFAKAFVGHRTATQRQRSDFVRERGELFNSLLDAIHIEEPPLSKWMINGRSVEANSKAEVRRCLGGAIGMES
jgi:hypothetical protein